MGNCFHSSGFSVGRGVGAPVGRAVAIAVTIGVFEAGVVGSSISAGAEVVGLAVVLGLWGISVACVSSFRFKPRRAVSVAGGGALLHAARRRKNRPKIRVRNKAFISCCVFL